MLCSHGTIILTSNTRLSAIDHRTMSGLSVVMAMSVGNCSCSPRYALIDQAPPGATILLCTIPSCQVCWARKGVICGSDQEAKSRLGHPPEVTPLHWPQKNALPLCLVPLLALADRFKKKFVFIYPCHFRDYHGLSLSRRCFGPKLLWLHQPRPCLPCWVVPASSWCFSLEMAFSTHSSAFNAPPVWILTPVVAWLPKFQHKPCLLQPAPSSYALQW